MFQAILTRPAGQGGVISDGAESRPGGEIGALGRHPGLPGPRRRETAEPLAPDAGIDPLELGLAAPSVGIERVVTAGTTELAPVLAVPGPLALAAGAVEAVLTRVAWGGDRRRGAAKLELDGVLAGTTVWIEGEGREVEVAIELGPQRGLEDLPERIEARLRRRGLIVRALVVR